MNEPIWAGICLALVISNVFLWLAQRNTEKWANKWHADAVNALSDLHIAYQRIAYMQSELLAHEEGLTQIEAASARLSERITEITKPAS